MGAVQQTDALNLCWQAWNRAWEKDYVGESVSYHATADFWGVAKGAIIGAAGGLAAVFIAETGGAVAGGALAAYFTAGNPAAVSIGAEGGFLIGQTLAEGCLTVLGIFFLYEFVKDHIGLMYPNIVSAYDLMVNQAPYFTGQTLGLMVDLAAREIAEAIGVFCGLILAALVLYVTWKITSTKIGQQPSFQELVTSRLNKGAQDLAQWLIPRLGLLRRKVGPPKLRLLEGGLPASTVNTLVSATQTAKSLMSKLVGRATKTLNARSLQEIDETLTDAGFSLIKAEEYGPPGGYQLFWQKGNVLVRFKTLGEKTGPRANTPHLSAAFNDGRGLDWQNDLGKFNFDGKIVAKVITAADKLKPQDFQGNPQKFVLVPQQFDIRAVDAWAAQTHFNADLKFKLDGLDAILKRAK